ncbi:MAG: C4-dicarboxylate ABC transporter permease [Deltaproteobacteria bacterium]|nr:MAG: C4-dicarboxylate ABC transporter permease [Deltaproteobacteria bacterium]
MNYLKKYIQIVDWINEKTGLIAAWLTTVLVLNVFYDTIMRYIFNEGNIGIQELEWHIFSVIFLLGAAYTLKHDGHVRVDIVYTRLSRRTRAWIDLIGSFTMLIPFCLIVIYATKIFVLNSWAVREMSPDPGGLPARYIIKAMIPAGFFLLLLQGISQAFKNLLFLLGHQTPEGGASE